jgi:hypothetical protein
VIGSPVTVQPDGTLSPGPSIGTLTLNNLLTLGGNVLIEVANSAGWVNDQVVGITTLAYGGTLTVTNAGPTPLAEGDYWTIFDAGSFSGTFTAIQPSAPGPGLAWDFNPATGVLRVVSTGPVTDPPPVLTNIVVAGQYEFSWGGDYIGFTLQSQTNPLSVGIETSGWMTLPGTEAVNTYTQAIDPRNPAVFFRLAYTNAP